MEKHKQTHGQLLFDTAPVAVIHQIPVNSPAFLCDALDSRGSPLVDSYFC